MYVWDKVKWYFYFQKKKLDLLPGALFNYLRKQDISLSSIVLVGNAAIILTCFFCVWKIAARVHGMRDKKSKKWFNLHL